MERLGVFMIVSMVEVGYSERKSPRLICHPVVGIVILSETKNLYARRERSFAHAQDDKRVDYLEME